ncbi:MULTISPECIES: hypothetical protein [Pseudomonas]|jgi:hypothetical protein|uniref:Uncharacterized protein n=1 Tax=Pseudomonas bijieensis TaxID=2681983 RepID=A0A6N1CG17_9PSED|nr:MULTISPECIES: hypothetical protein [Pseudomonas]AXP06288.1 hypothetical protein DZG01_26275 [Pseudomonas fluorescens]MCD9118176.1 hypothetical protein [Pseudomonas bijieensis]PWJ39922.1 hypothetical protein ATJ40_103519 [Pseudomonas sp. 43mfcvi1.1]QKS83674.1 hypothetical protein GN234_17725 [Pseudomonas bijieensis]UQI31303.1 hypothetical protein M3M50_01395 [Pseudomonas bijieensis]
MTDAEKAETVSYTLRNLSSSLDKTIAAVANTLGKSKNTLILETLEREFYNYISTYARSNLLVSAMDTELGKKFGIEILSEWYESEHTIQYDRYLSTKLKLDSIDKVDAVFKGNLPLLELRAKQLVQKGYMRLPRGISLTFALFIEIAKQDDEALIHEIRKGLFGITKDFYESLNEIRAALSLPAIKPQ